MRKQKIIRKKKAKKVKRLPLQRKEAHSKKCLMKDCKIMATTGDYCRLHYLTTWKLRRLREKQAAAEKLNRYIEQITKRYPEEYINIIRKDLKSEKDFNQILTDLDLEKLEELDSDEDIERFLKRIKVDRE